MNFNNSPKEEDLLLAQRLIRLLRQSEQDRELLDCLRTDNLRDPSIEDKLRSRVRSLFSTEVKDTGQVDKIINIAKANVVEFHQTIQDRENKNITPQNIPLNNPDEFKGLELEVEALHQLLSQTEKVVIYSTKLNSDKTKLAQHYAQLCYEKNIYQGGICWLESGEETLETQLLNFAKLKLGLKLPRIATLKDKVLYVWKNWQDGDVLIVINEIANLNEIKNFLSLNTHRFKLLIVTPKHLKGKFINCVEFESIALNYFKKDNRQSYLSNSLECPPIPNIATLQLICLCIFLFICSLISLLGAYEWYGSKPWISEFKRIGGVVELIRSGVFFYALIDIVFNIFKRETCEIFNIVKTPREMRKNLRITRILMGSFLSFVIVILLYYHLDFAPKELAKSYSIDIINNREDYFNSCRLPYLWYLPYSFINYVIVAGSIISVTLYSSSKDLRYLYLCRKKLDIKQQRISNLNKNYSFFAHENICRKIERDFEEFSRIFVDKIGRYSSLFLIIGIGVFFEVVAGRHTLAQVAIILMSVGYLLFFIALFIMLLASRYYEKALTKSADLLFRIECADKANFEQTNNVINFIHKIFNTYLSFYFGAIFFITSPIIGKLIESFFVN